MTLKQEYHEKSFEDNVRNTYELIKKGLPVKEISAKIGIAEGTVYVYQKRIKDKLTNMKRKDLLKSLFS